MDGDRDPAPRYDNLDSNAHGTKCAGIVSMQPNNDFCGVGMATGARLGGKWRGSAAKCIKPEALHNYVCRSRDRELDINGESMFLL